VVAAAVLVALYWAHAILVPVVLATLLTLLLSPLMNRLQRWGLGRIPAVIAVMLIAAFVIATVGWLIGNEFGHFLGRLPQYADNMQRKIRDLKSEEAESVVNKINEMVENIGAAWSTPKRGPSQDEGAQNPVAGNFEQQVLTVLRWISAFLPSAAELLGQLGFVIVLVIFMLLDKEALRNRFILLIGRGNMATTTKAVEDATHRISRFLMMQLALNAIYGLIFTAGLALIGIDYAPLWGFLAALLRYVPYFGAPIAAMFPLIISVVQVESWFSPLYVLGWFAVQETLFYMFVEPLLYGRSTGVSAMALLAAAAFWAIFWGPIGLILSCPLTVCLAVLGKYVPQLRFLAVILSDEPALEESDVLYQRLFAGDVHEASSIVSRYGEQHPPEKLFDDLLIPALAHARRDQRRGKLAESGVRRILDGANALLNEWKDARSAIEKKGAAERPAVGSPVHIVAVPAKHEMEAVALEMLRALLDPAKWQMHLVGTGVLPADVAAAVAEHHSNLIVIGAVQPGSARRVRYLCKQLRQIKPEVRIIAAIWGERRGAAEQLNRISEACADGVETSVLGLRDHLKAWMPIVLQNKPIAQTAVPLEARGEPAPALRAENLKRASP
jgi:predicted PurR-regulated permease PerM